MPIRINGETYYRTAEACQQVGISKATFFRWLKEGLFTDVQCVDRRGWRLFTENDLDRLKAEACQVNPNAPRIGEEQADIVKKVQVN